MQSCSDRHRVPTRTGKPGKMGRHFPVREKSGNFEQTGKVRENHTKYWKTEINWDKYYLIFLVIFKWTVHFLVKWIKFSVKKDKTLKKYWKNGKNTRKVREKSGNFISPEKWEPCVTKTVTLALKSEQNYRHHSHWAIAQAKPCFDVCRQSVWMLYIGFPKDPFRNDGAFSHCQAV